MSGGFLLRAGAAAAVASIALAAGAAGASAIPASSSGWRIVATVGGSTHNEMPGHLVATGPANAFSTWRCASCSTSDRSANFVLHWNGSHWGKIALPLALNYPRSIVTVGASGPSNFWAFASNYRVGIWNGSQWTIRTVPSWVMPVNRAGDPYGRASVFASGNVWVFSNSTVAAHFSGGTWHQVSMPGTSDWVSAVAPDDIWTVGFTKQSVLTTHPVWTAMHWNGSAWHTLAPPKVSLPAGASASYIVAATGSRSVFLVRTIWSGITLLGAALLQWNGSWHASKIPYAATNVGPISQDGHGGVWIQAWEGSSPSTTYLYHYGGGAWTRQPVPGKTGRSILEMSWIPGSRSLWAIGWLSTGSVQTGDILKYGP
jgi:hypothetical protein